MKLVYAFLLLCCSIGARAQIQLQPGDFNNLVTLSELYATNSQLTKMDFPVRPAHDEMVLWYAIDRVRDNWHDKKATRRPAAEIIKATLAAPADDKELLDSYYIFQLSGLASYFNTADLSTCNIHLDSLGFRSEAEKAIYYFHLIKGFTYGRFRVLSYIKNYKKLIEVANRLPLFNGKKYYEYTQFTYADFVTSNANEAATFNNANFKVLYETLLLHFNALAATGNKPAARTLYFSSVLYAPQYFDYAEDMKATLKSFYSQAN